MEPNSTSLHPPSFHRNDFSMLSAYRGRAPRSTVRMYGERKTIARCPCTPSLTVEMFGEKISAGACSGKEIAG